MPTPSRILTGLLNFVVLLLSVVGANSLADRYVTNDWARLALMIGSIGGAGLLLIRERSTKPLGDDAVLHLNR